MKPGQLVVALLESGFAIRSASEGEVTATRQHPRVILRAIRAGERWHVRTMAAPGQPRLDLPVLQPDTLIHLLQRIFAPDTSREVRS